MVFLTPMVTNLFASQIRSTIAFTLLMLAMIYFKGAVRYILFGLSSLIHLSMVPIISLYILFHMINRIKTGSTFIVPLFVLLLYCSPMLGIIFQKFAGPWPRACQIIVFATLNMKQQFEKYWQTLQ